jgi:hypothetical protein
MESYQSVKSKKHAFDPFSVKKYWKDQKPPSGSEKFTDSLFPPSEKSILSGLEGTEVQGSNGRLAVEINSLKWERLENIGNGNYNIFKDGIVYDDIKQCSLGHCYFVCVVANLAEKPEMIYRLFRTKERNSQCYFEVVLFIDGEWQIVLLDDYFVVHKYKKYASDFVFSIPNGLEIWFQILEKAWAKVNGGYTNIISGYTKDALLALTGISSERTFYKSENEDLEKVFTKLLDADRKGYFMACSSDSKAPNCTEMGIVTRHAYSLLTIMEEELNGEKIRLVKVRNPWAHHEWKGDYSDTDTVNWTDDKKRLFGYEKKDDGIFWMKFEDHCTYFDCFDICKVESSETYNNNFKITDGELDLPQVFNLKIHKKINLNISCLSWHWRFNREYNLQDALRPTSIVVAKYDENLNTFFVTGKFDESDFGFDTELTPGMYVIWVYCNYSISSEPKHKFYNIRFTSTGLYQCKKVKSDLDFVLIRAIAKSKITELNMDQLEKHDQKKWVFIKSMNDLERSGLAAVYFRAPKGVSHYYSSNFDTSAWQGLYALPPFKGQQNGVITFDSTEVLLAMTKTRYVVRWMNFTPNNEKKTDDNYIPLKYDLSEYLTLTFDDSSVKDEDEELIQKFSENQIKTPSKKIDSETKIKTDKIKIDTEIKVEVDSKKNKQDKILKPKPELIVNKFEVLLNTLQLTNLGKKVKYNKKVFFIHLQTKNTLHSHTVKYKNKDLQEVTCFKERDSNDYFTILQESRLKPNQKNKNSESSKDYIKKDKDIILLHHETQKAVHLDTSLKSPTTKQSLISARKFDTINEGFIWKFNIVYTPYGDDYIRSGVIVRIENHNIKLHSHGFNLDGGSWQQEVTGFSGKDDNNLWVVNLPLKTKKDK